MAEAAAVEEKLLLRTVGWSLGSTPTMVMWTAAVVVKQAKEMLIEEAVRPMTAAGHYPHHCG
jgi:hypothetical protein